VERLLRLVHAARFISAGQSLAMSGFRSCGMPRYCSTGTPRRYAATQGAASGRISILVSHRFSAVCMANYIVVLDGSRVAETGSHDELRKPERRKDTLMSVRLFP
jgi:hypothetical protein